jgi:hypothetical protein
MLIGYSAAQLFKRCPDSVPPIHRPVASLTLPAVAPLSAAVSIADVGAVFASRSEFMATIEPPMLLNGARRIRAAGLSLNLLCQQLADQQLHRMVREGTELTCLFLDPSGDAISAREREEEYPPGQLSTLTSFNIQVMTRLRNRLPAEARDRVQIGVYDETIRFNIILVDDRTCVVQPYLPNARGIDSPTLLLRRNASPGGLFPVFEQVYEAIAERSRHL